MQSREVLIYIRDMCDVVVTSRPRSKHNHRRPTVANDELVYHPMIYYKDKSQTSLNDLITYGTYVTSFARPYALKVFGIFTQKRSCEGHPLPMIKCLNIQWVAMKGKNQGLKRCNRLEHPWWFTVVSFPFMGQPWKIMTLSSIHWLSVEQKRHFLVWKYEQEGVAPPCNLPLLGLQNI